MSVTFKIVYKRENREPEIRRLTVKNDELNLSSLRARAAKLFQLKDDQVWYFKWEDEEKDLVTITEEYEFQELVQAKACEPVIRIQLYVVPPQVVVKNEPYQPKYGAVCDQTNISLSVEQGNWYHKPGSTVDYCTEVYDKLADGDLKNSLVKISQPSDLGADMHKYELRCTRGKGHHHHRWMHQFGRVNSSHVGWCDATNAILTLGSGWHHKLNSNYDLCESAYEKLSSSDKKQYVQVNKPEDLGADEHRYNRSRRGKCCRKSANDQPTSSVSPTTTATTTTAAAGTTTQPVSKPPREMKIVSGPSIPENATVLPGSRLIPIWEVENTGQGESAIWTDVRVKANKETQSKFQVTSQGFEVPMLISGARGIVSVELGVPENQRGQVQAEFALVDGDDSCFGEPLVLKLNVESKQEKPEPQSALPPVANENELVELLRDMGFGDHVMCTRALRECDGDVNAAALALLRLREQ